MNRTTPSLPGPLLRRNSRCYLRRHPLLMALSVLGVALGVAVVVGIDLANDSARTAFRLSTETVAGKATHSVVSGDGLLADSTYTYLRVDLGVRDSAPVLEGYARAGGPRGPVLQILGIDPLADAPFRSWTGGPGSGLDLGAFFGAEPSGLLSEATAASLNLEAGDMLALHREGRVDSVRIQAVLEPDPGLAEQALDNLLVVDISSAQRLTDADGMLTRIDLILSNSREMDRIAAALPRSARIEASTARSGALEQMTSAFSLNLTAMSLLAMVVGMFLIYNTMTFSIVQRRPLIGRLRGLGVTAREVRMLILSEALLIGLAGSAIGIAGGLALGKGLTGLVTQSISDLYFTVRVRDVQPDLLGLGKGLLVGIGSTLLATLAPAREATRRPPSTVLQRSEEEVRTRDHRGRWILTGGVLALAGTALLGLSGTNIPLSYIGILAFILAAAVWTPVLVELGSSLLRPAAGALLGVVGRMAASGIRHTLSRSAVAIAALTVAVAATSGVGIMVDSFRTTVDTWLRYSLEADVYISPPGLVFRRNDASIDRDVEARIRSFEGVKEVYSVRTARVDIDGRTSDLIVTEPRDRALEPGRYAALPDYDLRQAMMERDVVMVSEPWAFRYGTAVGDTLTITTRSGPRPFEVGAIYFDYASDLGAVQMARSRYATHFDDEAVSGLAVYVADGVTPDDLIQALRQATSEDQELLIRSNRDLRQASLDVFDQTFTVTTVLRLLTILVAFIGVLTALMALQMERARELAVLRANGMTPRQVRTLVTTQTGLMGLLAGLLSIPLGLLLAWLLIYVINRRSFGWTLQFEVDPMILLQALVLAIVAALVAGWWPGRKMSTQNASEALRFE
jgi:putative ABC transport system permease protein